MISQNDIDFNKNRFINLLKSVNREGVDAFLEYLESTDFYVAPASSRFHGNFEGGLCAHSLKVYDILVDLVEKHCPDKIDKDSIVLSALLHDLSKINFYEKSSRNKKVYSEHGSKHDELGNFDWVSELSYRIKDVNERIIYGNHEETAEFIARQFIQLSMSESVAILHHMGGLASDSVVEGLSDVYSTYPLAVLLHLADTLAAGFYC